MKKLLFLSFVLINGIYFGQQKSFKHFEVTLNTLEISTEGLDQITIENSNDNFISIHLDEENLNAHHIFSTEENGILKIEFKSVFQPKKKIFRKFITERLNRASVRILIPKNKNLTFLGNEIDIISKSYLGNINVYIDKGTLNFNTIKGDLQLILSSGNVFGITTEGKINLTSLKGKINIDNKIVQSPYETSSKNSGRKLVIKSIAANITLTNKKP